MLMSCLGVLYCPVENIHQLPVVCFHSEKDEILLVKDEIEKNINNPALRMTDKEHHDLMVTHLS